MFKKLGLFLALLLLPISASLAYYDLGEPTGFVNDYTQTLSDAEKSVIENKLRSYEQNTSNEVFVVVIQSLEGDYVENFANELFNNWGIGKKDKNNGVLFLVALDERKMRIEVGYGLEGDLTDAQTFQLIDKVAKPSFRNDDYYGGIYGVLDGIISVLGGQALNTENDSDTDLDPRIKIILIVLIILIIIFSKGRFFWFGGGSFGGSGRGGGGGFGGGGGGRSGGGGSSGGW